MNMISGAARGPRCGVQQRVENRRRSAGAGATVAVEGLHYKASVTLAHRVIPPSVRPPMSIDAQAHESSQDEALVSPFLRGNRCRQVLTS